MKQYFKNIFMFSTFFIVVVFATIFLYKQQLDNFKLPVNISTIIMGDSHTQAGVNDELLKNSINISQNSEHYFYSFQVLKFLVEGNSNIKSVVLGCGFHNFGANYDENMLNKENPASNEMYARYFTIFDKTTIDQIVEANYLNIITLGLAIYRGILRSISTNSFSFLGKYYKSKNSEMKDFIINDAIKRHYFTKRGSGSKFSVYQEKYLREIVNYCRIKNINIILLNTPLTQKYYIKVPKEFINHYYLIMSQLKDQIKLLDYYSLKLKKTDFGDGDHLNINGAKLLTKILAQ